MSFCVRCGTRKFTLVAETIKGERIAKKYCTICLNEMFYILCDAPNNGAAIIRFQGKVEKITGQYRKYMADLCADLFEIVEKKPGLLYCMLGI